MKNIIANVIVCILSLALCAACVYACCLYNVQYAFIPCYIAGAAIFLFFASLFHEFGHVLFGALAKIKVKIVKLKPFSSSFVEIIPKTDKSLKGRMVFTTLGGLALNLIFIALGTVALFVAEIPVYISLVLPASFYLFALNALPLNFGGGKTDGLVLMELLKNEDTAKVMLAVLGVQAQVLGGKPIEEVDENLLFGVPQICEDDINFISLTELRYEYFKAKGDSENAEKYCKRLEELKKEYL